MSESDADGEDEAEILARPPVLRRPRGRPRKLGAPREDVALARLAPVPVLPVCMRPVGGSEASNAVVRMLSLPLALTVTAQDEQAVEHWFGAQPPNAKPAINALSLGMSQQTYKRHEMRFASACVLGIMAWAATVIRNIADQVRQGVARLVAVFEISTYDGTPMKLRAKREGLAAPVGHGRLHKGTGEILKVIQSEFHIGVLLQHRDHEGYTLRDVPLPLPLQTGDRGTGVNLKQIHECHAEKFFSDLKFLVAAQAEPAFRANASTADRDGANDVCEEALYFERPEIPRLRLPCGEARAEASIFPRPTMVQRSCGTTLLQVRRVQRKPTRNPPYPGRCCRPWGTCAGRPSSACWLLQVMRWQACA